jgi:hypothetical protein
MIRATTLRSRNARSGLITLHGEAHQKQPIRKRGHMSGVQVVGRTEQERGQAPEKHVIEYTVDDEPQSTAKRVLTPKEILSNAGIDPATHYLVQIIGNKQESYKDKPDEPIHMHPHMKFVSVSTGSTPVS